MRKESKRFPRKRGNAFLVRIRDGLFSIGILHNSGCTTFFDCFLSDANEDIPDEAFSRILFTVDVQQTFFAKNPIYQIDPPSDFDIDRIPVPDKVIRLINRPFDPENPFGPHGPFPFKGGALIKIRDPLEPSTSSNGSVVIENLICEHHRQEIEEYELSVLHVNETLLERLALCHLKEKNVDPYKAKVFEDCAFLQDEHIRNTSWFLKDEMPLLRLKLVDGVWQAKHP